MVQDGQMTIFDFLPQESEKNSHKTREKSQEKAICTQKDNCDAFGFGCGGTVEPCRFGGAFHWNNKECDKDHTKLCDRWRLTDEEVKEAKSDLIKGFACAGCCWYCSQAPQHGGKCKFECRRDKQ